MTNDIVIAPTFSSGDGRQAKAYAGRIGRGRASHAELVAWHHAGRPVLAPEVNATAQPGIGRGKHTGKRGGASLFNLGGIVRKLAAAEAYSVRTWHSEQTGGDSLKGRLPVDVVKAWIEAGQPSYEAPSQVAATVYAHAKDKQGRKNGKELAIVLTRDDIRAVKAGKPAINDYVRAAMLKADKPLWPVQIVTEAMKINFTTDDNGERVGSWVSKRDTVGVQWVNA